MRKLLCTLGFNNAGDYAGGMLKDLGMPESHLYGFVSHDRREINEIDIRIVERPTQGGRAFFDEIHEGFAAMGIALVTGVASKVGSYAWAADDKYRFTLDHKLACTFIEGLQARLTALDAVLAETKGHDELKKDVGDVREILAAPGEDLPQMIGALATRTLPKLLVPALRQTSTSANFKSLKDPNLAHYLLLDNQWPFKIELLRRK